MQTPYDDLIAQMATEAGLDRVLVQAMICVESRGDPWAMRVEPAYLRNAVVQREATAWVRAHSGMPTRTTEHYLRACSFGLCQVLGQVAREYGCQDRYLTSLLDPASNVLWMVRILNEWKPRATSDAHLAMLWNAGPRSRANPATHPYVTKVRAAMAETPYREGER